MNTSGEKRLLQASAEVGALRFRFTVRATSEFGGLASALLKLRTLSRRTAVGAASMGRVLASASFQIGSFGNRRQIRTTSVLERVAGAALSSSGIRNRKKKLKLRNLNLIKKIKKYKFRNSSGIEKITSAGLDPHEGVDDVPGSFLRRPECSYPDSIRIRCRGIRIRRCSLRVRMSCCPDSSRRDCTRSCILPVGDL